MPCNGSGDPASIHQYHGVIYCRLGGGDACERLVKNLPHPSSLAQQILDALRDNQAASRIIRQYLPALLNRLREDLANELRGDHEHHSHTEAQSTNQALSKTGVGTLFAYRAVSQTSGPLSIHG